MNLNMIETYIKDFGKDVYSFCVYLTRNQESADDLYQQTFLIAMDKNELDVNHNPKSYLISIAANVWNNQKRKYLWRKKKADVIHFPDENMQQIADETESVEECVIKNDEIEEVRKQIKNLPEKMKVVILMYYMEGMTINEIAKALKISSGTVKSRLHQAKNKLKEGMMNYEG